MGWSLQVIASEKTADCNQAAFPDSDFEGSSDRKAVASKTRCSFIRPASFTRGFPSEKFAGIREIRVNPLAVQA